MSENSRRNFFAAGAIGAAAVSVLGFSRPVQAQTSVGAFVQLVRCKIKEGQEEAAVELMRELAEAHRLNSPECLVFQAHRSAMDPLLFTTYEVFTSKEAAIQTSRARHMQAFAPRYGQVYERLMPDREEFVKVDGFMR